MRRIERTMQAAILVAIAGLALAGPAAAQETPNLHLGLKAGGSSGSWNGVPSGEQSRKEGFVGGGFVTYTMNDFLFLQGEALYAQRGTELREGTFSLDYIEIPFLLGFRYDGDTVILRMYSGMSLAFKVRCDDAGSACGNEWNRTDVGVPLGGAVDVVIGRVRLGLDLRVIFGLTDLNGDELGDFKSRSGQATLGVAFPIG